MNRIIDEQMINEFEKDLRTDEKSEHAVNKYIRDIKMFCKYVNRREVEKQWSWNTNQC